MLQSAHNYILHLYTVIFPTFRYALEKQRGCVHPHNYIRIRKFQCYYALSFVIDMTKDMQ